MPPVPTQPQAFPPVITSLDFTPVQPEPQFQCKHSHLWLMWLMCKMLPQHSQSPLIQRTNHGEGALRMNAITGSAAPVIDPMHHHALPMDVMVEEEEENMS